MYLGLNLSHGSSACLVDNQGNLILAIEEERLSRNKNHYGIPILSIRHLLGHLPKDVEIQEIVHGSFSELNEDSLLRILANIEDNPSNPKGTWKLPRPGWRRPQGDGHQLVEGLIDDEIQKIGLGRLKHNWVKHHDAHLGTALASSIRSDKRNSLLITLDGEGDGESGTVAMTNGNNHFSRLSSTSSLDSLGYLYQTVTERYNFKGNQHEGKITGLAAFGKSSAAVAVLASYININNGCLTINYSKNKSMNRFVRSLRSLGVSTSKSLGLVEIVDLASSQTYNYEDLAFAVQKVLEDSVIEIVNYWLESTNTKNLVASGGVFANVKLNQRISDLPKLKFFDVFPNMGDGGLSVGGVWAHLSKRGELRSKKPYSDMFLAEQDDRPQDYFHMDQLVFEEFDTKSLAHKAAKLISEGKFVGLHYGKMEFGPRALGHRSLLLDPRRREILKIANDRLHRTEFMPFAPVVLDSQFHKYFLGNLDSNPGLRFMTITCDVKKESQGEIPGVTHIDGTARPQVIEFNAEDLYSNILSEFGKITGVGVLVNTSLNVHETPINFRLKDSIDCIFNGAIDYIVTENYLISRKMNNDAS